jgi:hypothetical protein
MNLFPLEIPADEEEYEEEYEDMETESHEEGDYDREMYD